MNGNVFVTSIHCHMQHGIVMCYSYTHAMQAEVECVYCEVCTECRYHQHRINSREGGSWVAVTSVADCM